MITETLNLPANPQLMTRQIDLDFLFLDLNSCTRCVGTGQNLEIALETVKPTLSLMGVDLKVNKILIESPEQAQGYHFVTSPTIRLNGQDIARETIESQCDSCTDLCGCDEGTNCRVWLYQGQEYTEAPAALLVEAILREAVSMPQQGMAGPSPYEDVPENLQHFFAGKAQKIETAASSCCSTVEQQTCCEPSAKASCCGEAANTGGCGCK